MNSVSTIEATAKAWLEALSRLTPATTGRKPLPILSMTRIDPASAAMLATADNVTAATAINDAAGAGDAFLVSYAWLKDAITSTTGRDRAAVVKVTAENKRVTVEAAGYTLRVETAPIADFPESPDRHTFKSHSSVDAVKLRESLGRALIASEKNGMLPVLASVHFISSPDGLRLYATDRYRLVSDFVPGHGFGDAEFTIPNVALNHMVKQFKAGSVYVGLSQDGSVVFDAAGTTYIVTPIEGDYPKLGELFERRPLTIMDVDRVQLLEAAKVASRMSERNAPAYLSITSEGVLTRFNDGLFGPDVAPLAAGKLTGDAVDVAFSARFLLEVLNSFKGKEVRIHGISPAKQFSFVDGGADPNTTTGYHHIVMPVRMPRD